MPQAGKDLIAYTGKEVISKVGADLIKNIIASVLCGENVRDLTEDLTKRRVAIINGALLTLFGMLLRLFLVLSEQRLWQ